MDIKKEYGKQEWQPVLSYTAGLQTDSQFPPQGPLLFPWENIGPGYCYGPAFGHWDAVHIALDLMEQNPQQAKNQINNLMSLQQDNGMIPSIVWMKEETPSDWAPDQTHPPVWVIAADMVYGQSGDRKWLEQCAVTLARQIRWFEENRRAGDGGFFYTDIKNHLWESGVDEGVRFIDVPEGEKSCVDASSHMYMLYDFLLRWTKELTGETDEKLAEKKAALANYIRERLYDSETGFFYDSWSAESPEYRHLCFEGLWPMIAGAALPEQAERLISSHLMNEKEFLSPHPVPTVALGDALYEKRMWRGPAWNSMTMWAAVGCMRYERFREAKMILEAALDQTSRVYEETGCIWEFYDSLGGSPERVARKPKTAYNMPCRDYLGHNPLHFMAMLWERCQDK